MKTLSTTNLFLLTDLAKTAILNAIATRLINLEQVKDKALTPDLKQGYATEYAELIKQYEYYSGQSLKSERPRNTVANEFGLPTVKSPCIKKCDCKTSDQCVANQKEVRNA